MRINTSGASVGSQVGKKKAYNVGTLYSRSAKEDMKKASAALDKAKKEKPVFDAEKAPIVYRDKGVSGYRKEVRAKTAERESILREAKPGEPYLEAPTGVRYYTDGNPDREAKIFQEYENLEKEVSQGKTTTLEAPSKETRTTGRQITELGNKLVLEPLTQMGQAAGRAVAPVANPIMNAVAPGSGLLTPQQRGQVSEVAGGLGGGLLGGFAAAPFTVAGGIGQAVDPKSTTVERVRGGAEAATELLLGPILSKAGKLIKGAKPVANTVDDIPVPKQAPEPGVTWRKSEKELTLEQLRTKVMKGEASQAEKNKLWDIENEVKPEVQGGPDVNVTWRKPSGKAQMSANTRQAYEKGAITTNETAVDDFAKSVQALKPKELVKKGVKEGQWVPSSGQTHRQSISSGSRRLTIEAPTLQSTRDPNASFKVLDSKDQVLFEGPLKDARKFAQERLTGGGMPRPAFKGGRAGAVYIPSAKETRAAIKAGRLANPVNRALDLAGNALSNVGETIVSTTDPIFDKMLFKGTSAPGMFKEAAGALKGGPSRWTAAIKKMWQDGDVETLRKYSMTEAPGVLKYVQRVTGMTDIPFRDFAYNATKAELKKLQASNKIMFTDDVIEDIAQEEAAKAVFMGDTPFGDAWKHIEDFAAKLGERALGDEDKALLILDQVAPFVRIISNVAGRTTDYAFGGGIVKGAAKALKAETLAQRREVVRLFSRGLWGAGLTALGRELYDEGQLKPIEVNTKSGYVDWGNLYGLWKPDQLGPIAGVLLFGAAERAVEKSSLSKKDKLDMIGKLYMDAQLNSPAMTGVRRVADLQDQPLSVAGKVAASGIVPSPVNTVAEMADLDSKGQPRKRTADGLIEPAMRRIPGLRQFLKPKKGQGPPKKPQKPQKPRKPSRWG